MDTRTNQTGPTRTILVVDNLEENRGILAGWLTREGYRVVEAAGGVEAVEEARRVIPDLILMDLKMPVLDGFGAAHSIHGDVSLRGVPIVAVSADNTEFSKLKAKEAGFCDYLVKPVAVDELRGMLDRLFQRADAAIH